MNGVQLIGKKAVLSRFDSFDSDVWAIYQGKQFIVSGVGAEHLSGWLTDFENTASTATYTLRIYDSDEPPTPATGNTDYIANVGFKAVDLYEGRGVYGHNSNLMERIGALEKQLKEKEEPDEDEQDLPTVIMGWLQDPVKLNQVAGAVRQILGTGASAQALPPTASPLQTISGVNSGDTEETKLIRLSAALDDLEKKDPKIVEHLEKLAKLANADPLIFQGVLAKLESL